MRKARIYSDAAYSSQQLSRSSKANKESSIDFLLRRSKQKHSRNQTMIDIDGHEEAKELPPEEASPDEDEASNKSHHSASFAHSDTDKS